MEIRLNWDDFKQRIIGNKRLGIQYEQSETEYFIWAIEGIDTYITRIDILDTPSSEQIDFENTYKQTGNKLNEIKIQEESIRTGGHYQCYGFCHDVPAQVGEHTFDSSFSVPISLLSAEWCNRTEYASDRVEFQIAPNTVVGTITSDVSVSDTTINVSSTVIDNVQTGYWVNLFDGTTTNDLGRVISIDKENSTITVETTATDAFYASTPTYVRMTIKMVVGLRLSPTGRTQLGESKIGGSYIPANTVLRLIYNNVDGLAKTFSWSAEYLY